LFRLAFSTCSAYNPSSGGFVAGDDRLGAQKAAVLTYRTWHSRFAGDPGNVGRALVLNHEPHEVIGVLPRSFEFPLDDADVWMPYGSYPVQDRERSSRSAMVLGRITSGVSVDEAGAELRQVAANLALTLLGIAVGLAGALALPRLVASQVYEVSPHDPLTFIVTAITLALVAITAAWLPTRRATAVAPVVTLRAE
jgi:hypothetical protein